MNNAFTYTNWFLIWSLSTSKEKRPVNISQYICVSNQQVVHLKLRVLCQVYSNKDEKKTLKNKK